MHEHRHSTHPASHHVDFDAPAMADFAELEGEVLVDMARQAIAKLADLCGRHGVEVRRVLDIGCGPGVGTYCLAQQFDSANVVAADGSATMLARVSAHAARLGLARRIEARLVELPSGLEKLERTDVVWASMVLHHVGDEVDALRRIRRLLEPSGLLAVVERADPLRVFTTAVPGRPGLWERIDDAWRAWFRDLRADLPAATPSADYSTMLKDAGFEPLVDEVLTLEFDAPLDAAARRYALRHLVQTRARLVPYAAAADLEALDALIDESADEGVLRRNEVRLRATRHLYVARAIPAGSLGQPVSPDERVAPTPHPGAPPTSAFGARSGA